MAHLSALGDGSNGLRVRVRTPGKYIVLYFFLPVALLSAAVGLWMNAADGRLTFSAVEYRENAKGGKAAYYNLPEFLVDLTPDLSGRTAYLKMRVSINLEGANAAEAAAQLETLQPAVVERLTFFLRELRPEDFAESDDMQRVKREMARRVNLVIAPASAGDVIIEDLIIQ